MAVARVAGPPTTGDGAARVTEYNTAVGVVIVSHRIGLEVTVFLVVILTCSCCSVVTIVAGLNTERIVSTDS